MEEPTRYGQVHGLAVNNLDKGKVIEGGRSFVLRLILITGLELVMVRARNDAGNGEFG